MHIIKVNLKNRSYNIVVGAAILKHLSKFITKLDIGNDGYIITNTLIKKKYGTLLKRALAQSNLNAKFKVVPDTEKSKSMDIFSCVLMDLARFDKKRRVFIVAFGGGVVGDLAGFIASVYKRGIPYIQIPTTLLAQIDSSIGGKTAVDLSAGKNLVGTFYQPRLVFSDVKLLSTLDLRQTRAGLAEAIKYGIIKDRRLFNYIEKRHKDILALKRTALEFIVRRASSLKAKIIREDETDKLGKRLILNFGHTIGHAIEASCAYESYNHGEAIAIGIIIASDISRALELIDDSTFKRIENLISLVGLPIKLKKASLSNILNAYYYDKKFLGVKNRFVLIEGVGKTKIVENVSLEIIREAIKKRL